ncbi:MAG: PEP-utilizing enzyme [bacterium]
METNKKPNWVNLFESPWTNMSMGLGIRDFAAGNPYKKLVGCKNDNVIYYGRGSGITAYHAKEELLASADWGLMAHKDQKGMKKYIKDANILIKNIETFVDQTNLKKIKSLSGKQLATLAKKNFDWLQASFAYYKLCNDEFQAGVGDVFNSWLKQNKIPNQQLLLELVTHTELTTLDKYEIEILKLAQVIKKHQSKELPISFKKRVTKITKKYSAIGGGSEGGKVWTEDLILEDIYRKKDSVADIEITLESLINKSEHTKNKRKTLIKKYGIPKELVVLVDQLASLAHIKYELRICWAYLDQITKAVFARAEKVLSYSDSDIKYLTKEEFIEALKFGAKKLPKDISNRKEATLFMVLDGKHTVHYGPEAISIFEKEIGEQKHDDIKVIRGLIASKGVARGRVVVVSPLKYQEEELSKVTEGDIFVTGMTRPHMLLAMKRAAAFVTDEGGITCHAAIIAREMKKPCIIATKIATKVLKDGDMVEVDANKGTIKIIE